jgi:hypothetical protein
VVRNKIEAEFRWWDQIDEVLLSLCIFFFIWWTFFCNFMMGFCFLLFWFCISVRW